MATKLIKTLRDYPQGAKRFEALADLIIDSQGRFLHGFNAEELTRDQVDLIIRSEHLRLSANFEDIYKTRAKYDGYSARVRENREFSKDWDILKENFPNELGIGKRVLRSERDNERSTESLPTWPRDSVFGNAFDFFCWKWFLDGMDGDEPIVSKLSFDVTPFGTTIFIPGYWSFDPKRDIRWKELLDFHQSRGVVKRQGAAFEEMRRRREQKEWNVLDAEDTNRALGESGARRIKRCARMASLPERTDPAQVYRLVQEAKQKKGLGAKNRRAPNR